MRDTFLWNWQVMTQYSRHMQLNANLHLAGSSHVVWRPTIQEKGSVGV